MRSQRSRRRDKDLLYIHRTNTTLHTLDCLSTSCFHLFPIAIVLFRPYILCIMSLEGKTFKPKEDTLSMYKLSNLHLISTILLLFIWLSDCVVIVEQRYINSSLSVLRPCSHCYSGTVIRHKFVPAQLFRHIGSRSHWEKLCRMETNIRA